MSDTDLMPDEPGYISYFAPKDPDHLPLIPGANIPPAVFLQFLQHEIRGQLQRIMAQAQFGILSTTAEEKDNAFRQIEEQVGIISFNLRALLGVAGKSDLVPFPFPPFSIVKNALDTHRSRHPNINIKLETELQRTDKIVADGDALGVVLNNLLSNAVRAVQGVEQPIIIGRLYKDAVRVFIEIEDNGCGISDDELPHIFDFGRTTTPAEPATSLSAPFHHGIGLFLVKDIIAKMQGSIFVDSEIGKYTKFTIILPIKPKIHQSAQ